MSKKFKFTITAYKDEFAGFIPAAVAIALLVMIGTFLFADGSIFQSLSNVDAKQRSLQALSLAHRAPDDIRRFVESTASGGQKPAIPSTLTYNLNKFSNFIASNINESDYRVWSGLYEYKSGDFEIVSDCIGDGSTAEINNSMCPTPVSLGAPGTSPFVVLSHVANANGKIIAEEQYPISKDTLETQPYTPPVIAIPTATAPPLCL